jgi:hypothetical protein
VRHGSCSIPGERALLGTLADEEVAERIGRTVHAVGVAIAGVCKPRKSAVQCVPGRSGASVDVTGERKSASQTACGVSDRRAPRPSACARMSM